MIYGIYSDIRGNFEARLHVLHRQQLQVPDRTALEI